MRILTPSEKARFQAIAKTPITPRQMIIRIVREIIVGIYGGAYKLTEEELLLLSNDLFARKTVNRLINYKKKMINECRQMTKGKKEVFDLQNEMNHAFKWWLVEKVISEQKCEINGVFVKNCYKLEKFS